MINIGARKEAQVEVHAAKLRSRLIDEIIGGKMAAKAAIRVFQLWPFLNKLGV